MLQRAKPNVEGVRYEVCKMIRMLVEVCSTLEKVPSEHYIFMRLTCEYRTSMYASFDERLFCTTMQLPWQCQQIALPIIIWWAHLTSLLSSVPAFVPAVIMRAQSAKLLPKNFFQL